MQTRKKGPASSKPSRANLGVQGHQLFNDNPKGPASSGLGMQGQSKVKAQYGTAERARQTLKRLRGKPKAYQRQVATTMYYRAKHHKYRTKNMEGAMKVYGQFLKKMLKE